MRDAFTCHKQANLDMRPAQLGCLGNRLNAELMKHPFLRVDRDCMTTTKRRAGEGEAVASPAQNCDHREGENRRSQLTDHGHHLWPPNCRAGAYRQVAGASVE
jgi:hypothetical protein